MPWRVVSIPELGVIEVVYTGRVTWSEFEASTIEAVALAKEEGLSRFLSSLENADVTLSTADIYELPKLWEGAGSNRRTKLVTVVPDSSPLRREIDFHVTTAQNRGWQVHVASQRQEAIDWLLSQS